MAHAAVLLVPNDLARLAPLEVIRVVNRVDKNEEVDEGARKDVHDVAERVLGELHDVAAEREDDGKRVQLERIGQH